MKPFQYKKPDSVYTQSITTAHGQTATQATFHTSDIRADHMAATDGFYPISTDGLIRAENFRSCRATLRRIRGL